MRPEILNTGYGVGAKLMFRMIKLLSRDEMPDAAKLTFYRPDFYGSLAKQLTHEVMRGESTWSVGERELMAAYVSRVNENRFCIGAHSATAGQALENPDLVDAVLTDLDTSPISEPLRATLRMLGKLTSQHTLDAEDMGTVLQAGASPQQIRDALEVCFSFNLTNRLADAFDFRLLSPEAYAKGATHLLKRGYR